MERQLHRKRTVELIHTEKIVEDNAVVIRKRAVRLALIEHLVRHFVVFHDRRLTVLKTENADLFLRSSLCYDLGARDLTGLDNSSDKAGVRDALENIVNSKYIQPLDLRILNNAEHTSLSHRIVPAAIAVRCSENVSFFGDHKFAVLINSRELLLNEEPDVLGAVSEVVVFLEEFACLLVIISTRHNEERYISSGCLCDLEEVVYKTFKDVKNPVLTDIEHTLRVVEAEAASLSAGKKHCNAFPLAH